MPTPGTTGRRICGNLAHSHLDASCGALFFHDFWGIAIQQQLRLQKRRNFYVTKVTFLFQMNLIGVHLCLLVTNKSPSLTSRQLRGEVRR
jgi:hypothetical protein